jgi:hypothetical protein
MMLPCDTTLAHPLMQTFAMATNVGFGVLRKEVVLMGSCGPSRRFGGEEQVTLLLVLSAGVV